MPLYHNNTGNLDAQVQKLWERIIMLRQAVIKRQIDPNVLLRIAELTTVQLEKELINQQDEELNQLYDIIAMPFPSELAILPSDNLSQCLQWFDAEHGKYLDLVPLAAWEPSDIRHYLNHLAIFYNVFIQGIILPPIVDQTISPDINVDVVHKKCREWEANRASQVYYDPHHRNLRLVDKFIVNHLSPDEWLTELDILDALPMLGLDDFGAHATNFDMRDIGAMLHFERQKHEHEVPAIPYTIPLVLNNSHRLDERGTHWTRLLITVHPRDNPKDNPPQITAQYTDSLGSINKKDIETTIRTALNYTQKDTTRAVAHPITAYPQCKKPRILMQGSGEQHDGYSCGYRALQGLLQDLVNANFIPNPTPRQHEFLACKTSNQLRDFIYKLLITEKAITVEAPNPDRIDVRANGRYVKPNAIEHQLRQWRSTRETLARSDETTLSTTSDSTRTDDPIADDAQNIHDDLQQCATRFNTKAYRNLLHEKFDLQPKADSDAELTAKLMGALLYLRYHTYRVGNAIAYARLKTESQKLVNKIRQSNNPTLIAAVAKAQQEHFSALSNHWTDHELQKGRYLRTLMTEWRISSREEVNLQWKKPDFFKTWWNNSVADTQIISETQIIPQTQTTQSQAIHWLNNYKDKWWKRGWVSGDRKAVASTLISQLKQLDKEHSSPEQILKLISQARQTILEDDTRHNRNVAAGLHGRLYLFLNDLETRVYAASSPPNMDNAIENEFNEIQTVLTAFQQRRVYPKSIAQVLEKIKLKELNPNNQINVADQYKLVSEFFTRVLTNLKREEIEDNADLSALYAYCQQKQTHLVHYFGQCNQLSAINQQRSVQVFRAMSAAASTVVNQWLIDPPRKKTAYDDIKYQDQTIPLHVNNVDLNELPSPFITSSSSFLFFNKKSTLNTAKIHKISTDLLATLAKEIKARSPNKEVNIRFTSLSLNPHQEPQDKKPRFLALTVALCLDGVDTTVTYTIKSQTGELARMKPELEKLDDPPRDCPLAII